LETSQIANACEVPLRAQISRRPGVREPHSSRGVRGDKFDHPRYERDVRSERETNAMTDITYDPAGDAVYITMGRGSVDRTQESGPFIYAVDVEGHIVGIEILSASKVLAPGDWKKAGPPDQARVSAAE
jgi:uncharacterized protein YuzE